MACASKTITLDEATDARWIKRTASRKREELRQLKSLNNNIRFRQVMLALELDYLMAIITIDKGIVIN